LPNFTLDHSRGRFRTYLYQVALNALNDWRARDGRRKTAESQWRQERQEDATADYNPEPESEWTIHYHRRVLQFALEQVQARTRPKTWACFEQHLLRGWPGAEVAAEPGGCTANALFVNASRVLRDVRNQCAQYLEELGDDPGHLPGRP
jgi:DNA-directed RNA polymerase specialized sigma24 family protein